MPASVRTEHLGGPEAADVLARLRAFGPVVRLEDIGGWLVIDHGLAVEVMRDADTFTVDDPRFSTAQVVGASMLSLDGVEHRRHRGPFVAPFRPSRVEERFGEQVHRVAGELVARTRTLGRADLRTTVAAPLSVAVVASTLGLPEIDADTVLGWYAAIVDAVSALSAGGAPDDRAAAAMAALGVHIGSGAAGSLVAAAGGSLEQAEVVSNAAVLMFGGIETTEGMIASAFAHLLARPDVLADARAEAGLTAAVVEESLRLEPAAAAVDRYATRDTAFAGVQVRRGELVRVSITAANRDPAVFADPDRFDPGRTNLRSQLAFARGPHACVAMDLARLEARAAVRAVLDGLPGLRSDGPAPVHGLIFRKPVAVPAAWDAG